MGTKDKTVPTMMPALMAVCIKAPTMGHWCLSLKPQLCCARNDCFTAKYPLLIDITKNLPRARTNTNEETTQHQ